MVLRFAGFELDVPRAELRDPDGNATKLRPKALALLELLAANAGCVVAKQEILVTVWPNLHVGDDNLFQCIRELRAALGDDQRTLIRLVSGQGYLFTASVSADPPAADTEALAPVSVPPAETIGTAEADATADAAPPRRSGRRRRIAIAIAGCCAIALLVSIVAMVRPGLLFGSGPPTIAVMPLVAADGDGATRAMAANVTAHLADGLAKIRTIHVLVPSTASGAAQADFTVQGELRKSDRSWDVRVRMTRRATGEIVWTAQVPVMLDGVDVALQQSRLVAGIGYRLAVRIGRLLDADAQPASTNAAIRQATDSIMRTTHERFEAAQTMLVKALADDPDNVDLAVALASLQLRGIQMVWYSPAQSAAARAGARATLEHALRVRPDSIPVLEAYCRFLNATNAFAESLVACARVLDEDPWDGMALYLTGIDQIQLGRFDDALATFRQADRFNTPEVSRWTWLLGAGWADVLMDHNADAVQWLQRSLAITPASGRTDMLLAVAYLRLGRLDEARATMAKALALRPGSTAANVEPPRLNASGTYLQGAQTIMRQMIALGLPVGGWSPAVNGPPAANQPDARALEAKTATSP